MKETIGKVIIVVLIIIASCGFIWGGYWVAKTVSYKIFYQDMVEKTVIELVRPEALR